MSLHLSNNFNLLIFEISGLSVSIGSTVILIVQYNFRDGWNVHDCIVMNDIDLNSINIICIHNIYIV
jgi:hypothetical protein